LVFAFSSFFIINNHHLSSTIMMQTPSKPPLSIKHAIEEQRTLQTKVAHLYGRSFFKMYNEMADRCFIDCVHTFDAEPPALAAAAAAAASDADANADADVDASLPIDSSVVEPPKPPPTNLSKGEKACIETCFERMLKANSRIEREFNFAKQQTENQQSKRDAEIAMHLDMDD
jgi:hypothetical protein